MRALALAGAGASLIAILLVGAQPADAFIYLASGGTSAEPGAIGRAPISGGFAQQSKFITGGSPCGVAVDGAHIYWANRKTGSSATGSIGRANLDGSGVDQDFIASATNPCGVAVDGGHVYWANTGQAPDDRGSIGRANLDGSGVKQSFVTGTGFPCGVAVDGAHLYWVNGSHTIGRANLDGSGVNQGFIAIPNSPFPCGVAADGNDLYWADRLGTSIGRANIDGSGANPDFRTGSGNSCGVAVDRNYVYWGNSSPSSDPNTGKGVVGRTPRVGSGVEPNFVTAFSHGLTCGVAVDSRGTESGTFSFGKVKHNRSRGTAKLNVEVDGAGKVALARTQKVKGDRTRAQGKRAGKVRLRVRPRGKAKRRLRRPGAIRVKARVTFKARGAGSTVKSRRLRLIRR